MARLYIAPPASPAPLLLFLNYDGFWGLRDRSLPQRHDAVAQNPDHSWFETVRPVSRLRTRVVVVREILLGEVVVGFVV